jgi:hypothetical protein
MEILTKQFGLLIAYLLPGFVALGGIAPLVPTVAGWLKADQTASFGAPLYALLAATAAGMTVSCFRWLTVDQLHVFFGVPPPNFNARALEERPAAFQYLVENHYRFYQFYANTLIAVVWSYSIFRWLKTSSLLRFDTDVGVLILCAVLFAGSRDALSKYRGRSVQLIGQVTFNHSDGEVMTNGIDHNQGGGTSGKPPVEPKPETKPERTNKPKEIQSAGKQAKG